MHIAIFIRPRPRCLLCPRLHLLRHLHRHGSPPSSTSLLGSLQASHPYKIGIIPKAWNLGLESHRTRLESRRTLLAIRQFGVNTSSSRGLDSKCPFPSPFQAPSNGLETDICFPSLWNQLGIPIKVPMGFQGFGRSAWNSFGRFLYWRQQDVPKGFQMVSNGVPVDFQRASRRVPSSWNPIGLQLRGNSKPLEPGWTSY